MSLNCCNQGCDKQLNIAKLYLALLEKIFYFFTSKNIPYNIDEKRHHILYASSTFKNICLCGIKFYETVLFIIEPCVTRSYPVLNKGISKLTDNWLLYSYVKCTSEAVGRKAK